MKTFFRKSLTILMAVLFVIPFFAGCGKDESPASSDDPEASSSEVVKDESPTSSDKPEASSSGVVTDEPFDKEKFLEDVKPVVDALYKCDMEEFCADIDFDKSFSAGYKGDGISVLYPSNEERPEDCAEDPAAASYLLVRNYTTVEQVRDGLKRYMTEDVINGFLELENDFFEFDGKLYARRGGRGYGEPHCLPETLTYVKEENGMQIAEIEYDNLGESDGKCTLKFKKTDEGWKLAGIVK